MAGGGVKTMVTPLPPQILTAPVGQLMNFKGLGKRCFCKSLQLIQTI